MSKDAYYHQRFFRILYKDMVRRINQYKTIQQIENGAVREEREQKFLDEQRNIISKFIRQEKYAISQFGKILNKHKRNSAYANPNLC